MTVVLAAVDGGPSSSAVGELADVFAGIVGAEVERWLVDGPDADVFDPAAIVRHGDPERLFCTASDDPAIVAIVIGLRAAPGGPSTGHVTRALIEHSDGPVVAVPPELAPDRRRLQRVLVPVEGDRGPSPSTAALVADLAGAGCAVVGVHVFDRATMPRFLDRWDDTGELCRSVQEHSAPPVDDTVLRVGEVGAEILRAAADHDADAILLEWHQDLATGRAAVVREVLGHTPVPVILVPDRRPKRSASAWASPERTLLP